ncbi:MAG: thioredoxin family protein [Phycisphaerae bacterium]|nr:thioredoxin family protein [Phycisphaerae bacterium]
MSDTDTTSKSSRPRTGEKKWLFWGVMLVALGAIVIYNNRPAPPSAVVWVRDFEDAKAKAAESNRLLLIDFYATWCGPCKAMDREVFPRTDVAQALGNWVAVKIDVDRHRQLARDFRVEAIPTLVALTPQGESIARISEGMDARSFIDWIVRVEKNWAGKARAPAPAGS